MRWRQRHATKGEAEGTHPAPWKAWTVAFQKQSTALPGWLRAHAPPVNTRSPNDGAEGDAADGGHVIAGDANGLDGFRNTLAATGAPPPQESTAEAQPAASGPTRSHTPASEASSGVVAPWMNEAVWFGGRSDGSAMQPAVEYAADASSQKAHAGAAPSDRGGAGRKNATGEAALCTASALPLADWNARRVEPPDTDNAPRMGCDCGTLDVSEEAFPPPPAAAAAGDVDDTLCALKEKELKMVTTGWSVGSRPAGRGRNVDPLPGALMFVAPPVPDPSEEEGVELDGAEMRVSVWMVGVDVTISMSGCCAAGEPPPPDASAADNAAERAATSACDWDACMEPTTLETAARAAGLGSAPPTAPEAEAATADSAEATVCAAAAPAATVGAEAAGAAATTALKTSSADCWEEGDSATAGAEETTASTAAAAADAEEAPADGDAPEEVMLSEASDDSRLPCTAATAARPAALPEAAAEAATRVRAAETSEKEDADVFAGAEAAKDSAASAAVWVATLSAAAGAVTLFCELFCELFCGGTTDDAESSASTSDAVEAAAAADAVGGGGAADALASAAGAAPEKPRLERADS